MAYQLPQNMTGINDILQYANTASEGIFGIGVIVALYFTILSYLNIKGETMSNSLIAAGYITSFTAVFFFLLGLVSSFQLFGIFLLNAIGLFWGYSNNG